MNFHSNKGTGPKYRFIGGLLVFALIGLCGQDRSAGGAEPVSSLAPDDIITNSIGMKLKLIPAGKFVMGAKDGGDIGQAPEHEVVLTKPFHIGIYEVTVGQFKQFAQAEKYQTKPEKDKAALTWMKPSYEQTDDHPVCCVGWTDAVAFCAWLSKKEGKQYALPTEAQWEYCCRAGSRTKYCFGDDDAELPKYAWFGRNAKKRAHPVGQLQPNAWGLYDMHGNVREWCADYYKKDYYRNSPKEDPPGPSSSDPFNNAKETRVLRGGIWWRPESYNASAFRLKHGNDQAAYHADGAGFRVVLLMPAEKK